MRNEHSLAADLAKGAIAGAVATFVMGKVTSYIYAREDPQAKRKEERARGGKTAYGVAAEKAADLVGRNLSDEERQRLGAGIHWALGIGMGALYGALRGRFEEMDFGHGLAFGTFFWGAVDETLNPVLGLTPGPEAFPMETHARGLAGHLTFGMVADGTLRVLDLVV